MVEVWEGALEELVAHRGRLGHAFIVFQCMYCPSFFQLGGGLKPSGGLGMGMGGLGTSYGMGGKSRIHLIGDFF